MCDQHMNTLQIRAVSVNCGKLQGGLSTQGNGEKEQVTVIAKQH